MYRFISLVLELVASMTVKSPLCILTSRMANNVFHTTPSLSWLIPSVPSGSITGLWHSSLISSADNA